MYFTKSKTLNNSLFNVLLLCCLSLFISFVHSIAPTIATQVALVINATGGNTTICRNGNCINLLTCNDEYSSICADQGGIYVFLGIILFGAFYCAVVLIVHNVRQICEECRNVDE
jgi:hypothetical protein